MPAEAFHFAQPNWFGHGVSEKNRFSCGVLYLDVGWRFDSNDIVESWAAQAREGQEEGEGG